MQPTQNRLIVRWLPETHVGVIELPQSFMDFHNSGSVQKFKVVAAGPGKWTRKGAWVENEIRVGDDVIVDARVGNRPEELADGHYLIRNPDEAVIGVCPVQV